MSDCVYGKNIDKGLEHYIICSKSGSYCLHQKYCSKRKTAVNTDDYLGCSFIKREEQIMAKTNSVKKVTTSSEKKDVVIKNKTEESNISKEKNIVEEKHVAYYDVLIATPSYYVLNINGCPTKIYENNSYKRGDIAEYK